MKNIWQSCMTSAATASAVEVRIYALIICNFERIEVVGSSAK